MSRLKVPVEEFTTPNPLTASEQTGVEQLAQLMKENGIRHIPIVRGDQVVGIVSDRDVRLVTGLNFHEKKVITAGQIMTPDPVVVDAEMTLDEVAFQMSEQKIGSVLVNEGDQFLGIFTVTDALNALIEIARSN